VGFNSEKCFTEVDENGNVADGIQVEVMELKPVVVKKAALKPVVVKKAAEERTSGEGQSPFGKMVECDDFVDISMGKGSRKEGRQLTRFFSCSNPSETSFFRLLREHLLCVHSAVAGSASFLISSISDFLDAISDALATRCSGAARRGAGRSEWESFLGEGGGAWLGLGNLVALDGKQIESEVFFPTVIAGLNNQQGGEKLLF
jgi:hypothetical protein